MARIDSLQTLLVEELRDMYDAEKRLVKAIPKLAEAATHSSLRDAFESHLHETEEHVRRLEEAFGYLDEEPKTKKCDGMRGLIDESDDHAGEDYENDGLRDAAIIGAAQRVEHYEIAAYGTAIAFAQLLQRDELVRLLERTLDEEKAADKKLSQIAESVVNLDAANQNTESSRADVTGEEGPFRAGLGTREEESGTTRDSAMDVDTPMAAKRTSSGR